MAEATGGRAAAGRSALAGIALASEAGVARLAEAPVGTRLVLRAAPEVAARLLAAFGLEGPAAINRATTAPGGAALRLGPDEWWLLLAAADAGKAPVADVAPHSLVDVGHRSVGLSLAGPGVEDVLAAGCPLPLDREAFPVGRATRTLFARSEIVLWRQDALEFRIEVARSFAPYLAGHLAEAIATEAGCRRRAQ